MRMIGSGSVEPETELLTLYRSYLYYLRRIRGRGQRRRPSKG